MDLLELTWTYLNLFGLVSDPEGCHYMSDLDSSLLLSSSGCSSREAVLLQHPPIDQVGHDDDDIYIMVKCLYVCNVFAYFYV